MLRIVFEGETGEPGFEHLAWVGSDEDPEPWGQIHISPELADRVLSYVNQKET